MGQKQDAPSSLECDVVIAGCGTSGLYAALNLPESMRVLMLSKGRLDECNSMLAQGGICVMLDEGDYESFYEDTMRAGHYENDPESVEIMIRESREVIHSLVGLGVRFERTSDGVLSYTREAGHSRARICHYEDMTGKEITTKLLEAVRNLPNVKIAEHVAMTDILVEQGTCAGLLIQDRDGSSSVVRSSYTVLATGGIGGLYERSTNYALLTGDACRIASERGIALRDMSYVQIHPTSLFSKKPGRAFLISESARGEGAILLDAAGRRFTDELQPRDVVTNAIKKKMEEEGSEYVRLSFENISPERIKSRFPNIYERCLKEGFDITREPIPVVPAQHYFMGGIAVDRDSQSSMQRLFAVGETSCNGVHGRNRLASNSLLEGMVFARRAACQIERLSALDRSR